LGLVVLGLGTLVSVTLGRKIGGAARGWDTFAVLAYSTVPIAASLFFVFPIQVGIFGVYLFGTNPPPMLIHPAIYTILLLIDGCLMIWSLILLAFGLSVVSEFSFFKGLVLTFILLFGMVGGSLVLKGVIDRSSLMSSGKGSSVVQFDEIGGAHRPRMTRATIPERC
jgi:hypothetical protein